MSQITNIEETLDQDFLRAECTLVVLAHGTVQRGAAKANLAVEEVEKWLLARGWEKNLFGWERFPAGARVTVRLPEPEPQPSVEYRHRQMVEALAKPPKALLAELTAEAAHLWHMATGVSGEAGELLDAVKKVAVYVRPIDRENVIEELGDLEFYMRGLRDALGITREETLEANIKKLAVRYAGTAAGAAAYSNAAAQNRADKAAGQ